MSIVQFPALGATPEEIWTYHKRELTQARLGFWSAIITQAQGAVSVPAHTTAYVTIKPPAGEVWLVSISMGGGSDIRWIIYDDFNGTTARRHFSAYEPTAGVGLGACNIEHVLTGALYARLGAHNFSATAVGFSYGYSGFKLSGPLWSPEPQSSEPLPWKRPLSAPLPPVLKHLTERAAEILGADPARPLEYVPAVILEEDTVLARDPTTGATVEALTVVVSAEALARIWRDIIADIADRMGYRRYKLA